jgi:hypothetical protein
VHEIESSAATLAVPDTRYGRPDAVVAGAGSMLELDNIPVTTAGPILATTGGWSSRAVPMPVVGTSTLDWTGGQLLDGTRGDRIFLVDQASFGTYTGVTQAMSAAPTMIAGTTTKVDASALAPVPLSACKHMAIDPTVIARGMRSDYPTPRSYWQLFAEPLPQLGLSSALPIAIGSVEVDAYYPTVYPGLTTIAAAVSQAVRPVSDPNPSGTQVSAAVGREVVVADDGACSAPDFATQIGVPGTISIQGVSLGGDHATVTAAPGTRRIAVTWDMLVAGPVDDYVVQLVELPAGTGPVAIRRVVTTTDPQIVLDPALFDAGREYYILVTALLGIPDAGAGDFTTFASFEEFAWVSSPTFTVAH